VWPRRALRTADNVVAGAWSELQSMPAAQAIALDAVFSKLARWAVSRMEKNLPEAETYFRLAIEAQAQCRMTVEALAEIKNPRHDSACLCRSSAQVFDRMAISTVQ
jgi:hypothetical protein